MQLCGNNSKLSLSYLTLLLKEQQLPLSSLNGPFPSLTRFNEKWQLIPSTRLQLESPPAATTSSQNSAAFWQTDTSTCPSQHDKFSGHTWMSALISKSYFSISCSQTRTWTSADAMLPTQASPLQLRQAGGTLWYVGRGLVITLVF